MSNFREIVNLDVQQGCGFDPILETEFGCANLLISPRAICKSKAHPVLKFKCIER